METGTEISQVNKTNLPQKVQPSAEKTPVAQPKTAPLPNDVVEISTGKNKDPQSSFGKVAALLASLSVIIGAGTFGGVKIYDRYFQKLASGIKKGEIHDALYHFIKKNDPRGLMFDDKNKILQINEKLTDDNLLILKQLTKMQDENSKRWGWVHERFTLDDMTELMTGANEFNIKYLEQLAKKSETKYDYTKTFETRDILNILRNINPDNEKVASQLIDISDIRKPDDLEKCLSKIKKDNVDVYQLLLSTRKKGPNTELSIEELQKVADILKDTKNPKCAEFFLNQEKNDGSGLFRYDMKEIEELLRVSSDDKIETYQKLCDLNCTKSINSGMPQLVQSVTEDNIDIVEPLLTKKYESLNQYIFNNWSDISEILQSVNKNNNETALRILDIVDRKTVYLTTSYSWDTVDLTDFLPDLFREISKSPEKMKTVNDILDNGLVEGKQTLTIQNFYNAYRKVYPEPARKSEFFSTNYSKVR